MGFVNRLIWIFVSPSRVFEDIRRDTVSWWQPWVWQSIFYVAAGYLSLPVQRAVAALNRDGLPADQLDQQLELIDRFWWLQLTGTPPVLLLVGAALAGLTYVLVTILSPTAKFKQYFTITLYASIIGSISMLLSAVLVRMRGVETIRTAMEAQVSLGLGFLAPEGNPVLFAVLSSIEVFAIWSLVVLGMGLVKVFDMSRNQAIACVIPWWIIYVIMAIVGSAVGGLGGSS
jgi:hypothetical protein